MKVCVVDKCPALAVEGHLRCAAHLSTADRVPRLKNAPAILCVRCGLEIRQGDWRKSGEGGYVHAGYTCEPRDVAKSA